MTPTTSPTRPDGSPSRRYAGLPEMLGYLLLIAWVGALAGLALSKFELFGGWDTPADNAAELRLTIGWLNAVLAIQGAGALLLLLQRGKRGNGAALLAATLLLAVCTSGMRASGGTPTPDVTPTGCYSRSGGTNTCAGG
ncbi:hypothetical protein [Catellatospora chokoriensis]|uniref:Uncharacterized protein n=1 Tax=Catellatospora chokoriensis TaxID=310353 RepID=A0A8J3JZI3_9ACTN|nr:hypothetical protein [Catellatospora chokoriensis]GIF86614.1 hypothetical protein Cch02nite_00580 [Catellatospora chokoriensis]